VVIDRYRLRHDALEIPLLHVRKRAGASSRAVIEFALEGKPERRSGPPCSNT
jgi:hypothetical protein